MSETSVDPGRNVSENRYAVSNGEDANIGSPGFFGKLPTRGDFVERRLPRSFVAGWDAWLQRCLAISQANLSGAWLDTYLTSPIWQFAVSSGVLDDNTYVGVIIPSVDKVGRYFPLSVVSKCDSGSPTFALLTQSKDWFLEIESILLGVLDEPPVSFESFDADIGKSCPATAIGHVELNSEGGPVPAADGNHLHFPLGNTGDLANQLMGLLSKKTEDAIGPHSVWLTRGSEVVEPSLLICPDLPDAERFTALLDGGWQQRHWQSCQLVGVEDLRIAASVVPVSAAISDVGKVREVNEDAYSQRDVARIWAVADGLGGHQAGEIASAMVTGAVDEIGADTCIEDRVTILKTSLSVVQKNLQQMAVRFEEVDQAASTVVVLLIDDKLFACVWAGDSRIYRLRDGILDLMTRDHTDDDGVKRNRSITRAVGGGEPLELDVSYGTLKPGDRFLLCSDGLYEPLGDGGLLEYLIGGTPHENCLALQDAVLKTDAPDNLTAIIVDVPDFRDTTVIS